MLRKTECLSRKQRCITPLPMCHFLRDLVASAYGQRQVSVLWAEKHSEYKSRPDLFDVWDVDRDARLYDGPGPIIAHPPCGPWGKFRWRCNQSKVDGLMAMQFVHVFGGVVEQPLGSRLFKEFGDTGKVIVHQPVRLRTPGP